MLRPAHLDDTPHSTMNGDRPRRETRGRPVPMRRGNGLSRTTPADASGPGGSRHRRAVSARGSSRDKRRGRRTSPEPAAHPAAPSPKSIWPVRLREYNPCKRWFTPTPRGVKYSGPGCHNASGDWSHRLPRSRPGPALQAPAYPRPPASRTSGCTRNSAAALNRRSRCAGGQGLPKRQSAGWRKRRRA